MQTDKDIKSNQENKSDLKKIVGYKPEQQRKICKYAILTLVCGIMYVVLNNLGIAKNYPDISYILFQLLYLLTIVLFIVALFTISKNKNKLKGISIAIAGIIVPSVWITLSCYSTIYRFKLEVTQQAQFVDIGNSIELFNSKFDGYPPSETLDPTGKTYCGTMKLTEAVMGRDLKGFHPESIFRRDGMDTNGTMKLYTEETLEVREGPFIPVENATAYKLNELYENVGPFVGDVYILCDIYKKKRHSGKKIGTPILYYKADTSKTAHDINNPDNPDNIYNYKDNHALLALGVPSRTGVKHPMYEDPTIFYKMTKNYHVTTQSRPFKADTFILLSAGKDGLFGTKDDLGNFDIDWKWKMAN